MQGTCRATHKKDGALCISMTEGIGKWVRDNEGRDAFDRFVQDGDGPSLL